MPVLFYRKMAKSILILGIGNILLGDEGFGVRAVEYLQDNYSWPENVQLLDGGTRGLLLMADLMDKDLVIILDIVHSGHEAGTMLLIENDDLYKSFQNKESAHQTSINDVLICCELADHRPEVLVFGFEPFDFSEINISLSPQAQEKLPLFCENVISEMRKRKMLT